jgi:hypothetical protein
MKREIFIFLAFSLLLSSCATKKWCNKHYPQIADTVIKEVVKDSIVIRDTTVYVSIPGETEIDSIPIPCPPPPPSYVPRRVYAETSLARASAWWQYPNIMLELVQKDTTIERRLEGAIREAYHWKSEYQKITVVPEPVKYIPKFYKFCTKGFFLLLLSGIVYLVIKFKLYKLLKP